MYSGSKPQTRMLKELEPLLLPLPEIAFLATPLFLLNSGRWRIEAAIAVEPSDDWSREETTA